MAPWSSSQDAQGYQTRLSGTAGVTVPARVPVCVPLGVNGKAEPSTAAWTALAAIAVALARLASHRRISKPLAGRQVTIMGIEGSGRASDALSELFYSARSTLPVTTKLADCSLELCLCVAISANLLADIPGRSQDCRSGHVRSHNKAPRHQPCTPGRYPDTAVL